VDVSKYDAGGNGVSAFVFGFGGTGNPTHLTAGVIPARDS
jgi:hypothetical protein